MKNHFGLTLVELLVALAIISILVALMAPQFGTLTTGSKQASAANALTTDIAYTRNEAITRNTDITIEAKTVGTTKDWANGWTVTDVVSKAQLRNVDAVPAGVTVTATGTSLTYKGNGTQSSGATTIKFCNSNLPSPNNSGLQIEIVNITGRQALNSNVACP